MSNFITTAARRGAAGLAAVVLAVACGIGLPAPTTAYADASSSATLVHQRNLLRAHSFTDHGYAKVSTLDSWEGEGDFELADCGMLPSYDNPGVVNRRFRLYQGARTTGEQLVLQFESRRAATDYERGYRQSVAHCASITDGLIVYSRAHRPAIRGASSARWWSGHSDEGWTRSYETVSLVRVGDRVSVLTMSSVSSKPRRTMDVPALMQDMVDRLAID